VRLESFVETAKVMKFDVGSSSQRGSGRMQSGGIIAMLTDHVRNDRYVVSNRRLVSIHISHYMHSSAATRSEGALQNLGDPA
jgi:hypothetical protein